MAEMVKKHKIALFLNKGTPDVPDWVRIKKSTAFDLSMNPETQEFDYIADESPTTELMKYKPSLNQALTMYKGEPDYELIFNMFYELKTGSDAKTEVLIVFYQEEESENVYKAWKSECVITCNDLNSVDSTLTFDINFGGTVGKGTANISSGSPVFTSATETGFSLEVTVTDGSDPVAEATVEIGGVQKTTDAEGKAVFTLINGKKYTLGAYKDSDEASEIFTASSSTTTKSITLA